MKLRNIELQKLEIPFRLSFKHASTERSVTEAVIATAHSDNDVMGYGESCPRGYVTNESIESCLHFLRGNQPVILQIDSIESLKAFVTDHRLSLDQNPAAWCAIETAILDLLGRLEKKSIETIIGIPEVEGSFQYTAVLGVSTPPVFQAQLAQYLQLGFADYKMKISGDISIDTVNLTAIRSARPDAKIRLDANNLWHSADESAAYLARLDSDFWAVEEPVKANDYSDMKKLARQLNCKIILDESFLTLAQLSDIQENPEVWIPNIRISKMGGLLRSLAIAEECRKCGLKFIIGAQVGETSILTRAAISLAATYRDILIAQEGGYGTYLLKRDVTANPIMFGKNGKIVLNAENANGLGLNLML